MPPPLLFHHEESNPTVARQRGFTPRFDLDLAKSKKKEKQVFKLSGIKGRSKSLVVYHLLHSEHRKIRRVRSAGPLQVRRRQSWRLCIGSLVVV